MAIEVWAVSGWAESMDYPSLSIAPINRLYQPSDRPANPIFGIGWVG